MTFDWYYFQIGLYIFKKNLKYPLECFQVPPGVHVPPFENHCSRCHSSVSLCGKWKLGTKSGRNHLNIRIKFQTLCMKRPLQFYGLFCEWKQWIKPVLADLYCMLTYISFNFFFLYWWVLMGSGVAVVHYNCYIVPSHIVLLMLGKPFLLRSYRYY